MPLGNSSVCIYCRTAIADTRDHVPPELLFPPPKPSTLITVPSCRSCNSGFQKDDEAFAMMLTALIGTNPVGRSIWQRTIAEGLLRRSPRFRDAIGRTLHYQPYTFPDGHRGYAPALLIERPRILRVLRRIVRGLSWHEYHNCDFPETSVRVLTEAEIQALPMAEARRLSARYGPGVARVIAEGVFEYHHATAAGRVEDSAWWLIFYGETRFLATVGDASIVF